MKYRVEVRYYKEFEAEDEGDARFQAELDFNFYEAARCELMEPEDEEN